MTGSQSRSVHTIGLLPKYATKASRIGRPRQKLASPASTVTSGRISAGNSTLRIRLPPATSTVDDSSNEDENHDHGRSPLKMRTAWSHAWLASPPNFVAGMTAKTKV